MLEDTRSKGMWLDGGEGGGEEEENEERDERTIRSNYYMP